MGLINIRAPQTHLTPDIRRRMAALPGAVSTEIAQTMRTGPGSFAEQFADETTWSGASSKKAWKKTSAFGRQPPPSKTLQRTGRYRNAWLGQGAGSVFRVSGNDIAIGIDSSVFPQAVVFQGSSPTRQRVTPRQRVFLGMQFGVWLKVGHTITNTPRAVRYNHRQRGRIWATLAEYIIHGRKIVAGDSYKRTA